MAAPGEVRKCVDDVLDERRKALKMTQDSAAVIQAEVLKLEAVKAWCEA